MQKKLTLNLDQLAVDSFDTDNVAEERRGTVRGNAATQFCDTLYDGTCRGYGTCGIYPCKPIP